MKAVVLVPRRDDGGHRDKLWAFARKHWARLDLPIVEGYHEAHEGPFNRSLAVNRAAVEAGRWDVALVIDSDVLVNEGSAREAIRRAGRYDVLAFGWRTYWRITEHGTRLIVGGYSGNWHRHSKYLERNDSSCVAIGRRLWEEVGGFDPGFRGWGREDSAFRLACSALRAERVDIVDGDCWHLWHPYNWADKAQEMDDANLARLARYEQAHSAGPLAMRRLLAECHGERAA